MMFIVLMVIGEIGNGLNSKSFAIEGMGSKVQAEALHVKCLKFAIILKQ